MTHRALPIACALALVTPLAQADKLEELLVTARHDTRTIDVTEERVISADVTQLIRQAPGANVNSNGPLVGIPQYRGMYGQRIATSLDGMQLAPSGPNWMDPPLSYARSGQLAALEVYRGIAPVSVAQESIGGAIEARSDRGSFHTDSSVRLQGRVAGSLQSANSGGHLEGALHAANKRHKLRLAAVLESGDDARFPGGDLLPTEYERQRYDIGYGLNLGEHRLQVDYGYNDTGVSGTPALPMDIDYIRGDLYSFGYRFELPGALEVKASVFGSALDHGMTNYHLRTAPGDKARWRRNIADSDNLGLRLHGTQYDERGHWNFGIDGFDARHNSDIDNPNSTSFFVENFNDAERRVLGLFLERDHSFSQALRGEFGLRYNRVDKDADEVDGTPAMMMPPAAALRDAFNAADRKRTDHNVDLVARLWLQADSSTRWYAGVARKNRSASYQERYLWLPLEATAGLADGNTYTGNVALKPEVAHEVEGGLDFTSGSLSLSPRLFYTRVDDYIQGTPSDIAPAVMMVQMMNMMNGTRNPDPLQFNNVDATLYGFDMDWRWQLTDSWSLSGIVNYVRGERDDIDDNLYRIAPPNTSLRLDYARAAWSVGVEGVFYRAQDRVSETNREQETSGYGLLNVSASWQAGDRLLLSAGVDNLLDREYQDHLAGYNRAQNPDIALRERLYGTGANVYARATYRF